MAIENDFDGGLFKYIDSDAYLEDGPMDVALDALTYNQAANIIKTGRQTSWAERQVVEQSEPTYFAGNQYMFWYSRIYVRDSARKLEVTLDHEVRPQTGETDVVNLFAGVSIGGTISARSNPVTLDASTNRERKILNVDVSGVHLRNRWVTLALVSYTNGKVPNEEELGPVEIKGDPATMRFVSGDPTQGLSWGIGRNTCIAPNGLTSGRSISREIADIVRWAPSGYSSTTHGNNFSVAPPTKNMIDGTSQEVDVFNIYGIRPYSVQVRQYVEDVPDGSPVKLRAGKLPRYATGAGQQVNKATSIQHSRRTTVLECQQAQRPDTTSWPRHPRWHYLDAAVDPYQVVESPMWLENQNAHVEIACIAIGLQDPKDAGTRIASEISDMAQKTETHDLTIEARLNQPNGTNVEAFSTQKTIKTYPTLKTGEYPLLLQRLVGRIEPANNQDPSFTFREGQIGYNLRSLGTGAVFQRATMFSIEFTASGMDASAPHHLEVEYDISAFNDDQRLIVLNTSATQQTRP